MRNAYSQPTTDKIRYSSPNPQVRIIDPEAAGFRGCSESAFHGCIDSSRGAVVVEFGMPWGEHCRVIEPLLASVFARHADVQHIKIERNGRRLSRLFNVKFWPTLIFLNDGKEIARLVRPNTIDVIEKALVAVTAASKQNLSAKKN